MKRLFLLFFFPFGVFSQQAYAAFADCSSVTESNESSITASHQIDYAAVVPAGALVFALLACDNPDCNPVTPSGWTQIMDEDGGGGDTNAWMNVTVGDEDGGALTVTTGGSRRSAHQMIMCTEWAGTLVTDVDCSTLANGTDDSPDPGAVTAGWGVDDNKYVAMFGAYDDDATVSAYPTNYSDGVDTVSGGGTDIGAEVGSATRELAADNDDPGAFTLSEVEGWGAIVCVVKPAAAAGSIAPQAYYIQDQN